MAPGFIGPGAVGAFPARVEGQAAHDARALESGGCRSGGDDSA